LESEISVANDHGTVVEPLDSKRSASHVGDFLEVFCSIDPQDSAI
jgi:hypothetical protein